jgi:hypothetical protein
MTEKNRKYICNICEKFYASSASIWFHNKKFHTEIINKNKENENKKKENENKKTKDFPCKYCNKLFSFKQSRSDHEKNYCKMKNSEIQKLREEIQILKKQNKKTINNINNGTINNKNIIINQFGNESISLLSQEDIKKLATSNFNALVDIVKLLNFNENYPENHNFCTTSLEGDYVNVLNPENNQIEKINKMDFYNNVLSKSLDKVNQLVVLLEFDEDYKKLKPKFLSSLENIIKDPSLFLKANNKKIYNKNINQISYNNKELVLNTWNKLMQEPTDDTDEPIFTDITNENIII